jgi:hypothetical protein
MNVGSVTLNETNVKQAIISGDQVQQAMAARVLREQLANEAEQSVKLVEMGSNKKVGGVSVDIKI